MRRIAVFLWMCVSVAALGQTSADLELVPESPTTITSGPGQSHVLLVRYRNRGPNAATGVRLILEAEGGAVLQQTFLNGVLCPGTFEAQVCAAGDLPPNGVLREGVLQVNVGAPIGPNVGFVRVLIRSEVADPVLINDLARFTIETVAQASLRPVVEPHAARAEPGQRVTFTTAVENIFTSLPGIPLSVRFTATNSTIEEVVAASFWSCRITSPTEAVCTERPPSTDCCLRHPIRVTVRTNPDPAGGAARVDVRATSQLPDPSPHESVQFPIEIYRMIGVTSTADAGAGSLRAAIDNANGQCTPGPCRIVFRIPPPVPAEGWFTITPSESLPAITAERVILDAETQTAFTGDTNPRGPEIAIDGRAAQSGLVIDRPCDAGVRGLAIGNFAGDFGLTVTRALNCVHTGRFKFGFDSVHVSRNHLGVDPSGTVAWPNLRGLRFDDSHGTINGNVISGNRASGVWSWSGSMFLVHNRIGVAGDGISAMPNGASGVFVGPAVQDADIFQNIIANHPQMGVAAARGARDVQIRENAMHSNGGLGIDWGLDGVSPQIADAGHDKPTNPPVLLSAVYDPTTDRTLVTLSVNTRPLLPSEGNLVMIDIYFNRTPDGDGESWILSDFARDREGAPFTITIPGNYLGRWLNATATRNYSFFSRPPEDALKVTPSSLIPGVTHTSEFSNSILVGR